MVLGINDDYVKTALKAVLVGAGIAERSIDRTVQAHKGNLRDIVTAVDRRISKLLINELSKTGIQVVSEEESNPIFPLPPRVWVVDPIDGTVNFVNGSPLYAISIGLLDNLFPCLGFVCVPALNELYFTDTLERSLFNGRPLVHEHRKYENSVVAASFSSHSTQAVYDLFQKINVTSRGCLRTGTSALNICWVARGRMQGAYGFNVKIWDVVGALAIAKAAGCAVWTYLHKNSVLVDFVVGSTEVTEMIVQLAKEKNLIS